MLSIVPPQGGPPPHIHLNEDETFYVGARFAEAAPRYGMTFFLDA